MSLLGSLTALLVVSVLVYAVARLYGSAVHGSESALTRLKRALRIGLVVVGVVALVAFVGAGGVDAFGDRAVGDLLSLVAMAVAVFVADGALYLGLFPAVRAARDIDAGTAWAAARFGRWFAAFLALIVAVVYGVGHADISGTWGALALAVGLIAVVYGGSALVVRLAQPTRKPTDGERGRLAAACERANFDPRSVRVVDSDEARWAGVLVRGPRGYRTLFVGSRLLDAYGDDALAVQVVSAATRANRGYHEARFGSLLTLLVALLVELFVLGPGVAGLTALLAGIAAATVLLWYGGRIVYAADRAAAAATSPGTVAETYRAVAADADQSLDAGGRIRNFLRMRPALRRRLARLEERAD